MRVDHRDDFLEAESFACGGLDREDLPLAVESCGRYAAASEYYVTRRGMDSLLLIHTQGGRGVLTLEDKRYALTQDTCALIDCRQYHDYRTAPDAFWWFEWVHFRGAEMDFYADRIGAAPVESSPAIFKRLHSVAQMPFREVHEHKALTDILYTVLCARYSRIKTLDGIPALMEASIGRPLSLDDMARHVNMSKYHFLRVFKEQYGATPADYFVRMRVGRAVELLKDPSQTQKAVAEACGFGDVSNFIRCFKRVTGATPSKYTDIRA